jgi:hypothetical protein
MERRSVTEWHESDERTNHDKIDRARQAAEALFKPMREGSGGRPQQAIGNGTVPPEQEPKRQPRIFAIPPRLTTTAEAAAPLQPKPATRPQAAPRRRGAVPPSEIGRVRALATYGMTKAQVAELYGVAVGEIEQILKGSTASTRSR